MASTIERRLEPLLWRLLRRVTREAPLDLPQLTPDQVREAKHYFQMDKFFIFGHERSGTALLGRLVRTHPDVHCDWTGHYFTHYPNFAELYKEPKLKAKFSDPNFRWNQGQDAKSLALRAIIDFLLETNAREAGKRIVGDKSPNTYANDRAIRFMNTIYPDGKLIYIVRDGRDVLVSQRFRQFIEFPDRLRGADRRIRARYVRDPEPFFRKRRSIFTEAGFIHRVNIWLQNVQSSMQAGRELLGERFFALRFEDLISQPVPVMESVWRFLGADSTGFDGLIMAEMQNNPVIAWQDEKNVEQMKTVAKGRKGTWQELFTLRDRRIFKELAGETLIEHGYERDLNW